MIGAVAILRALLSRVSGYKLSNLHCTRLKLLSDVHFLIKPLVSTQIPVSVTQACGS